MDRDQISQSRRAVLRGTLGAFVSAAVAHPLTSFAQVSEADKNLPTARLSAGRASMTAQGAAALRAAHQLYDEPRVFDDAFALPIVGPETEAALRSDPDRYGARSSLRAFIALRSRYAEDGLDAAVRRGVRQYVILGAGLDTFAYRNPHTTAGLRVFEVDHPATQTWKRSRLVQAGMATPGALTFAPVDFERQTIAEGLRNAGFDSSEPAYFSWLGVVVYLTRPAIMSTLDFVAVLAPDSEIAFDYGVPDFMLSETQRAARAAGSARVAAIGEPWITYFEPSDLERELHHRGFGHIRDFGAADANARYFKDRDDGLRVTGAGRLMSARI